MYIWFWNPKTRQYESSVPTVAPQSDVGVKFEAQNLESYPQYLTPRIDMWFNDEWFSSFQGSTKLYAPGEIVKCEYHTSCPAGSSGEVTASLQVRTGVSGQGVIYKGIQDLLIANVSSGAPPPPPPDDYEIHNVQFYDGVSRKWVDFTPVGSVGTDVGISITIMNNTSNSAHFDATIRFRDAEGHSVYLIDRSGTVNPGYAGMGGPATTQTIFDSWSPGEVTAEVTIEIDGETLSWDGVIAEAAVGPPPGEADLSGKVTCAGKAISSAYATLDGRATHTDVSGYYYFNDLALGTYLLEITKDGYNAYSKFITLEEGDNTCNVFLTPSSGLFANLFGLVIDSAHVPISAVNAILDGEQTVTDAAGVFKFLDKDIGLHSLTCKKSEYDDVTETIQLNSGDNYITVVMGLEGEPNGGVVPPPSEFEAFMPLIILMMLLMMIMPMTKTMAPKEKKEELTEEKKL